MSVSVTALIFILLPTKLCERPLRRTAARRTRLVARDRNGTLFPYDFKLMAVYPNFALATDHMFLQSESTDGKVAGTETRVLRMFVKLDGKWRPAGAAMVPIIQ